MAYRNYSAATSHIVSPDGTGDFTTIQSAITAATAPATIFIRPGTYTENPTLKPGVDITGFGSDPSLNTTGNVIINGTCTLSTAGSVTISGIQLQTNSAAFLIVSGSVASIVNLDNCFLNCLNSTGITFSSSSGSSAINIADCAGNIATTGITLFANSDAGTMSIDYLTMNNSGASTTASTISSGSLFVNSSVLTFPLTSSTNGSIQCFYTNIGFTGTALTTSGTGLSTFSYCNFLGGGSSSAISIGAGTTMDLYFCSVSSANANAITGSGNLIYTALNFNGSSRAINSTVTIGTGGTLQGSANAAPTIGFLGEQVRSAVSGVSITTNATPQNATSISCTAGIWDISALGVFTNTGSVTSVNMSINTTSATLGTTGDNEANFGAVAVVGQNFPIAIPSWRLVLSTTTTVFLVVQSTFSTGAASVSARISATRVG
jgi:hypothetical protein